LPDGATPRRPAVGRQDPRIRPEPGVAPSGARRECSPLVARRTGRGPRTLYGASAVTKLCTRPQAGHSVTSTRISPHASPNAGAPPRGVVPAESSAAYTGKPKSISVPFVGQVA